MKTQNTRRAFLMSIVSLLLCFTMMLGTTLAWFTDSVTVSDNRIVAGNLDVELYYKNGTMTDFDNVANAAANKMFVDKNGNDILWEPGVVAYTNFEIRNVGNLALKYALDTVITDETTTVVDGVTYSLKDVIKVAVLLDETVNSRDEAIAKAVAEGKTIADIATDGKLLPEGDTDACAVVLYWAPNADEVDNKYNLNNDRQGDDALDIEFDIKLFATQYTHENDSFNDQYDSGAMWVGGVSTEWYFDDPDATEFTINSAEELAGLAAIVNGTASSNVVTFAANTATTIKDDFKGKTIKLAADIDLNDRLWTPIGDSEENVFRGNFDGQGHTVYNLKVDTYGWAGLIGHAGKYSAVTIKNVNVEGVTINANRLAGSVVGQLYGSLENCHVKNAVITVIPNAVAGGYDNGDKVGGIVGWLGDNNNNHYMRNCSAENVQLGAYRDVGGLAGYVAKALTVEKCSADYIDITVDQITNYYGDKAFNAGAIWGRNDNNINASENTEGENISIGQSYIKDGIQYKADAVSGDVMLYKVPADYASDTVTVPEGVTTIGGYAFAYNTNIDKIVLPETVTTLADRAFRDTTASDVVLNEGLKNISYQAFRNASNVTTVEIPSTVTTISKEAFQNSGITSLTIPANVTTIEYGGLRDMKMLETVIIEGNVDIPVYAFRACTNLKTVIIKGDDVTFGGGSRGMIFTNKENGDGSAITIFVSNETVKERLLANDTAAKDYGGYKIVVGTPSQTTDDVEIAETLANGGYVIMGDDVATEADKTAPYGNKYGLALNGGVLDGNGNKLDIDCYGDDYGIMTTGGTIKNVVIEEGCRAVMIMYPTQDIILDNVKIGGDGVLYPINTGEAGAAGIKLTVTNSTLAGWTSYSNIESASFTNVKFEQGTYYDNIYGRVLKPYVNTTLTDCSFISHMNLDLSSLTNGHKITMKNCKVDGQDITLNLFTVPTTDDQYDTEIFTVDLPSWATSIEDCIVIG